MSRILSQKEFEELARGDQSQERSEPAGQVTIGDVANVMASEEPAGRLLPMEAYQPMLFGQTEFGEPDISFLDRMRVSSGDNFEEQRNIFKRIYPEGSFEIIPGTSDIVFQRDPSESFRRFNPPGLESTDVAEFLGSSGLNIAGEIAATLATRRPPTDRFKRIFDMAAGGAGGELVQQGIQESMGVQAEPFLQSYVGHPVWEGALSFGGGVVGEGLSRSLDGLRGAGIMALKPDAREAIRASRRLGLDVGPLPGQTVATPFVERVQGQAAQTSAIVGRTLDRSNESLNRALDNLNTLTPDERSFVVSNIAEAMEKTRRDFINSASFGRNMPPEEFGQMMQAARQRYVVESQAKVTEAYNTAASLGEPTFTVTNLQAEAAETARRTTTRTTRPGEPEIGRIVDERGVPLAEPTPTTVSRTEPLRQNEDMARVRDIADQIARSDPESIGIKQLQDWYTSLGDLSVPSVPGSPASAANRRAVRLRNSIDEALDTAQGVGPNFARDWRTARELARVRNKTIRDSYIMQIGRTDRPSTIVDTFSPENLTVEDINILRRVMDGEKFADTQGAFAARLLLNPDGLTNTLNAYREDVLKSLLSPQQLSGLQRAGREFDKINSSNIGKYLQKQTEYRPFFNELVTERETARISALRSVYNDMGGPNSDFGKMIRSGLIDSFYRNAVEESGGRTGEAISRKAFSDQLKRFRETGLDQFLTTDDLRGLREILLVRQFIDPPAEGVAGLVGAETAAGAMKLRYESIKTLVRNMGVSAFIVSPPGRFLIQGIGAETSPRGLILPMTTATLRAFSDMEDLGQSDKIPSLSDLQQMLLDRTPSSE